MTKERFPVMTERRYIDAADSHLEFVADELPATLWALLLLDTELDVTPAAAAVMLALAALYDVDRWCPWGSEWYTVEQVATYARLPRTIVQGTLDRLALDGLVHHNVQALRYQPLIVGDAR